MKPQHFQQQQRYIEYHVDERISSVSRYLYGITSLSFNSEFLTFGRIAIEQASGVMPDGTNFSIPQEDVVPEPLEIDDASLANQIIYLTLPIRSDALQEVSWPDEPGTGRYHSRRLDVRDVHTIQGDSTIIDVSSVKIQLMLERDDRSSYTSIAIGKIQEKRPDGSVVLDPNFIPCHLNVTAVASLHHFVNEMAGLIYERAKNIAIRIGSPSQGGVADVSDFMLLQTLNRLYPHMQHLAKLRSLHPERLYECLYSICGELATFTSESRMPPELPGFDHDKPTHVFSELMRYLRQSLSVVLEPRAVSVHLEKRKYGLMVASIQDSQLVSDAEFIVAVKARMPLDELRKVFVQQTKVASVETIRDLIARQLPGIPLVPLPVAPRQLPYHAGYTYYQLDKSSNAWNMLNHSTGFAFHIAAAFEELDVQFWAIRS